MSNDTIKKSLFTTFYYEYYNKKKKEEFLKKLEDTATQINEKEKTLELKRRLV